MQEIAMDIVQQCQQGKTAVFSAIVQHYERALFAYVARLNCAPNGRTCEDVVQEIFVKAYTSLARFRPHKNSSFTAWLFRIAHNHCVSLGRRKQLESRFQEDSRVQHDVRTCPSPVVHVQQQETLELVSKTVQMLDEPMRSTFIMRYYEDMPYADIARALGCNEQTARTRVARAKKTLSEKLLDKNDKDHFAHPRSDRHVSKTQSL